MSKQSELEKALLQVETLEEAVRKNSKEILRSTMKEDLYDILKEQEEEEEEDETPEKEDEIKGSDEDTDSEDEMDTEEDSDEDMVSDDVDSDEDMDSEDDMEDEMDSDEDMEDDMDSDEDMEDEMDSDEDMEDDTLDMTNASDEEVLKVFKAMKPEDGIVVKKEGNQIKFEDDEDEYIIKLDDDSDDSFSGEMNEEESHEMEEEEEVVYEIDLDDDDSEGEDEEEMYEEEDMDSEDETEEEMGESARTIGFGVRGPKQKKMFKAGRPDLQEEYKKLKKQNQEYKKALKLFKEKLNEIALFNANLTYATRLFTEQTTTKKEKLTILERFDTVNTISESKLLYQSIKNELNNKKPITETVTDKIISTPKSSISESLSEAKAYENAQFKRMKELMFKK